MTATTMVRPTWRHWGALAMLGLPLFMMATDFTAIFLAVPAIGADLTPSSTQMLWLVHIGELVAAGTLITMGWLTGRLGPRTLLLVALVLYGVASALAAYAPSAEVLITARVLIGVATAALSPAAFALLRSLFSSARHYGIGFAVVMGAFPAGTALGPPLTGALLEYFWWGSVFLVNVPVAAVALLGGLWLFPSVRERTTDRIDLTSVVLSMTAIMLVVFALQEIADQGFTATYGLTVGAGIGFGAWFIHRQRRLANPLLDLGLFTIRLLRLMTVFFALSQVAFMTTDFVLIQHLQVVLGVSTGTLGLVLAVPGIAAIVSTALTPMLSSRFTPRAVMTAGIGAAVVGTVILAAGLLLVPSTAVFAVGMTIVSFGMSPPMVLGAQLMLTSVSQRQAGPAASLQDISASLGAVAGIGALGSLATATFGRGLRSGAPDGVSVADLDTAAESPGGAVAVAEATGGSAGDELFSVIDDAWTQGTLSVFAVALAIGVVLMVIVVRGLRGVQLPSDEVSEDQEPGPAPVTLDASWAAVQAGPVLPPALGGDSSSGEPPHKSQRTMDEV